MTGQPITRRKFLGTTGMATATLVGASVFEPKRVYAAGPFVRSDVGTLSASSSAIVSYKNAITAMKALPDTNPLSWSYQAAIHGTLLSGSHPAWNTCEHGTYFFFSWHRMYLYYFERIIRKMSGDANFALPYWNYEAASERHLPEPFRSPADPSNPLYTSHRGAGWNSGSSSLNSSAVNIGAAFPNIPFTDFSSSLEGTPHGAVHVSIGGWMGSVPTSAQDPIFWLHHCNIDRLWNLWLAQHGGRSDPLSDATWKNTPFTFFNENGKMVHLTGCNVLRAQQELDYKYDAEPPQVNQYCIRFIPIPLLIQQFVLELPPGPIMLRPGVGAVPVQLNARAQLDRFRKVMPDPTAEVHLDLTGVEADRQPDVYYEIYVNLPKGATPEFNSPYYVGNLVLFGHGVHDEHQHHGFMPANFSFGIKRALAASLQQAGGQLNLLFVPRGSSPEGETAMAQPSATIRIGKAAISVHRLQRR